MEGVPAGSMRMSGRTQIIPLGMAFGKRLDQQLPGGPLLATGLEGLHCDMCTVYCLIMLKDHARMQHGAR